jgi:hypothetical protein
MKKQIRNMLLCLGAFGAVVTASAQTVITSTDDPALIGAGLTDFDSATIGYYSSLAIDGVTITAPGDNVRVQNTYSGEFNTTGNYLDNNAGSASTVDFTFDSPQAVFGLNYGALDDQWTLSVYDSDNNLIDSTTVEPNHGSNAGEFIGIASSSANIAWASFTDSNSGDWILLDNLRFTPTEVPEPSTLALAGLGGLGLMLFRRRK